MICNKCLVEKEITYFYLHSNGKPRKYCKLCHYENGKKYRKLNPAKVTPPSNRTRQAVNKWRKNNLSYDAMRQRERTALKNQRFPSWANRDKIKKIYQNCPVGFHVDHIVPLKGKFVSGLHVEFNLQYLPALENIRKKNHYV